MPPIEAEIASQPDVWRRAVAVAAERAADLPASGERIALIGCGTSHYVSQSVACLRESRGLGESDAFAASEFFATRGYDRLIAISRSGTTTEVVRALEAAVSPTLAVTAVADSPIAAAANETIALGFADEEAVVQTRFATAVLALCRAWLGQAGTVEAAAEAARTRLGEDLSDITRFEHFVFLGTGPSVGLAHEAALKLEEAAAVWTEAFPAMEYRHGPISAAGPQTLVWPLGPVDREVLAAAEAVGATVVRSGDDPLVELVAIQRAAVALAIARERDPSFPEHLTRSVVLG